MLHILLPVVLAFAAPHRPVVAIQPFGHVDPGVVARVRAGVAEAYAVDVVVLPEKELPAAAYYRPRNRYRADALLEDLDREASGKYTKIVGLTARDISTSTEEHADWGVFGLGDLGGTPCVVSTYRLGRGGASEALVDDRLQKAVGHELGHTFGLDHCTTPGCLMADAEGTIRTVDAGSGRLCPACLARLRGIARAAVAASLRP